MAAGDGEVSHAQDTDAKASCTPELWLERYGDALYRQALFRTGDTAVAEDLVQETLLAAWRGRECFQGRSQERTWLYGILEHKIQDHHRQNARSPITHGVDADDPALDIEEASFQTNGSWMTKPGMWGHDPQEAAERGDFLRAVQECLEDLPAQQRTAFLLREWDGEEIADCAATLAVTVNYLSVLLHRARLQIRECLGFRYLGEHILR